MDTVRFEPTAQIERREFARCAVALRSLADRLDPAISPPATAHLKAAAAIVDRVLSAAIELSGESPRDISVPKQLALDLVAELLAAGGELHRVGRHLEGFAAEGMQGRILEALLGAGSVEVEP